MNTQEYHDLLDDDGVQAISYEPGGQLIVFVDEKKPENVLHPQSLARNRAADIARDKGMPAAETDVIEVGGEASIELAPENETEEVSAEGAEHGVKDRVRPVEAGISEINQGSTAATSGLLARVVDPSIAGLDAEAGDVVRLSNMHVYGRSGDAAQGETIVQQSPLDGGDRQGTEDKTGEYLGGVALGDGVPADASVRSIGDAEADAADIHAIGKIAGVTSVGKDRAVTKTGRTTGTTEGKVLATQASFNVNYGSAGKIRREDVLVLSRMSKGGDSGSPLVTQDTREFCGHIFAGSPQVSIADKAENIESLLGVEVLPERPEEKPPEEPDEEPDENPDEEPTEPPKREPEADFIERAAHFFRGIFGPERVKDEHRLPETDRQADIIIYGDMANWYIECENDAEHVLKEGPSQAMLYAAHGENSVAMVLFPDAVDMPEPEYTLLKRASPVQFRKFREDFPF